MRRRYKLQERARQQEATRRRIIEATVALHGKLGPMRTSILAIAERAGVERPTVYRHFPTIDALFAACSDHYWKEYPLPDPETWRGIGDPAIRLRHGLEELYAYYRQHELTLWNVLRDIEDHPELRRFARHPGERLQRSAEVLSACWRQRGPALVRLRACIGHAIEFFAWRSLRRQGLSDDEIVDAMAAMVTAFAATKPSRGAVRRLR
jgi:AcrR family transcriptional regulator